MSRPAATSPRARWPLAAARAFVCVPLAVVFFEAASFRAASRCDGALVSSGERREYLLHVPKGYRRGRPVPLVLSLHAAALWPAIQKEMSRWNEVADEHGFLVAYPAGSGAPTIWHAERGPALGKDVRFLTDLIDSLSREYDVDPARIYANGLSNGGGMSFALSCLLPDRIAAVGLVGAAQMLPWSWCPDTRPVPMIAFHGTADRFVPYGGGESPVPNTRPFPSVPRFTSAWARRNGCAPDPAVGAVAPDVERSAYGGCAGGADVVLYTVKGGGHTWPGGVSLPEWMLGRTSDDVDATRLMWAFFEAHPRRGS